MIAEQSSQGPASTSFHERSSIRPTTESHVAGRPQEATANANGGPAQSAPFEDNRSSSLTSFPSEYAWDARMTSGAPVDAASGSCCVQCISIQAKCELRPGYTSCTRCALMQQECILGDETVDTSPDRSGQTTPQPPQPPQERRYSYKMTYKRNRNPCIRCRSSRWRCSMPNGQGPCERCAATGETCIPKYPGKAKRKRGEAPGASRGAQSSNANVPAMPVQHDQRDHHAQKSNSSLVHPAPRQPATDKCIRCERLGLECVPANGIVCRECRARHTRCTRVALPVEMPDPPTTKSPEREEVASVETEAVSDEGDTSSDTDSSSDESCFIKAEPAESPRLNGGVDTLDDDARRSTHPDAMDWLPHEGSSAQESRSRDQQTDPTRSNVCAGQGSINALIFESNQSAFSEDPLCKRELVDMWTKCKYVRESLLSAQEIVAYLNWFSQNLAPLSKIVDLDFAARDTHEQLLKRDPMLGCSLLVISSRFMTLPGPGGLPRSHYIHGKLWKYCEEFIQHIRNYAKSQSRVLGAIESLLLLSDWLPRAAQETIDISAEWSGELVFPETRSPAQHQDGEKWRQIEWKEEIFDPEQRSERMSRRLIRAAVNIARVSGVFIDRAPPSSDAQSRHTDRVSCVRDMLSIYHTTIASHRGPPFPEAGLQMALFGSSDVRSTKPFPDVGIRLRQELTRIVESACMAFSSPSSDMERVLEGKYERLESHWLSALILSLELILFLLIEHHHMRACLHAPTIHALVQRVLSHGGSERPIPCSEYIDHSVGLFPVGQNHLDEVKFNASRIFELACTLQLGRKLRYAPLRVRVCILSVSIFSLKAVALRTRLGSSAQGGVHALRQCVGALKDCGIDELDFAPRHGQFLGQHLPAFLERFVPESAANVSDTGLSRVMRPVDFKNIGPCTEEDKTIPLGINLHSVDFLIGSSG
ncbi:Fungal Zn(2)-Cys(6) binuclear cluster domain-containing protein [Penicillium ucsense]|uniref:Fungal Zn(2)-Cys(6) binuclear cluster domain-containing protein n=1 Tax=Penicillium ucsense TaxID=2839758 RepID=A0A8J8VVM0_9EURO|nr:Fungal Zn(2)-Cys(6) binuclear cluster domain-containing protein [Penicillium ucsense]KAF7726744.1 Fungal Zn(2)-Cys(6) binuclear cluster domain-containing protein [Penicillium ucsense]